MAQSPHHETARQWNLDPAEKRVVELNALLRSWSGYSNQGRVIRAYRVIRMHAERRLRRWLMRLH
jgi:Group II intron, maturase-specific domain